MSSAPSGTPWIGAARALDAFAGSTAMVRPSTLESRQIGAPREM